MRADSRDEAVTQKRPRYSRDEVVASLTSYYKFLVSMYLHEDDLLFPPPGGWPDITQERFGFLGKSDIVIDLLRHIPYVRRDEELGGDSRTAIYEYCTCVDYRGDYMDRGGNGDSYGEPYPDVTVLGPYTASIAITPEADGHSIFIDTERGVAVLYHSDGDEPTELSEEEPEIPDQTWRSDATYLVPDLFEKLKKDFQDLAVVPINQVRVFFNTRGDEDENARIFKAHGWPSSDYQKIPCLRALYKARIAAGDHGEGDEDAEEEKEDKFPTLAAIDNQKSFPSMMDVEYDLP